MRGELQVCFVIIVVTILKIFRQSADLSRPYITKLKELAEDVYSMWVLQFGPVMLQRKQYLHGLTHLRELEEWCLDHDLQTLELYTMQGTFFKSNLQT